MEKDWKHGGADALHERRGANADIEAGEVFLELEPAGGDLKDETAQPTTLDVENLRGNIENLHYIAINKKRATLTKWRPPALVVASR